MLDSEPKRSRLHLSPDRFVVGLLLAICLIWLSDHFQWFGFNHHKGWTVLMSVAAVVVAALVMLLWWFTGLIFHWHFQFGIRSLLAFCLASSVAAVWLAVEVRQARRQQEAVERIRDVLASVYYDWEFDANEYPLAHATPAEPGWLQKMLGVDFFSTVVVVTYNSTTITDAELQCLKDLTELRELTLNVTNTTDTGLEYLKGLTQLRGLYLIGTPITDAGLEHLKGLIQLRELGLYGTKVTDAGVERLQHSLPNCQIER